MSLLENFTIASLLYLTGTISLLAIFKWIFEVKLNKRSVIIFSSIYILSGYLGFFLEIYFHSSPEAVLLKNLISFCSLLANARYIFHMRFSSILLSTAISILLTALGQIVNYFILSLMGISIEKAKTTFHIYFISFLIIFSVVFFVLFLIAQYKKSKKFHSFIVLKGQHSRNLYINIFVIIILIFTNAYFELILKNSVISPLASFIKLLFAMLVLAYSIIQMIFYSRYVTTVSTLKEHLLHKEIMQSYLDEIKRIKHNYINTINTLNGFSKLKHWDGLLVYLEGISKDCQLINSLHALTELKNIDSTLLGLIGIKHGAATEKNIEFNVVINSEIKDMQLDIYKLCDILGCLLDNAIEAADESLKKSISLKVEKTSESFIFKIENSYKEKPDINNIFNKGFSTRGIGRGNGLWYLKSKLQKQKDMMLNTFIKENTFVQEIIIEKTR